MPGKMNMEPEFGPLEDNFPLLRGFQAPEKKFPGRIFFSSFIRLNP